MLVGDEQLIRLSCGGRAGLICMGLSTALPKSKSVQNVCGMAADTLLVSQLGQLLCSLKGARDRFHVHKG